MMETIEGGLSPPRHIILISVALTSSFLSLAGSVCILITARKRLRELYHRLIAGLSCADIIVTLTIMLQVVLFPPVDSNPLSIGNARTCSMLGFLMRFPLCVATYNCALSMYSYFTVVRQWKAPRGTIGWTTWEAAFHCVAFGTPVLLGVLGVVTDAFHPVEAIFICDYSPAPFGCHQSDALECTAGQSSVYQDWCYLALFIVMVAVSIFGATAIYFYVRRRTASNQQWEFAGLGDRSTHARLREVVWQAILYTLIFLNSFLWCFVSRTMLDNVEVRGHENDPLIFASTLVMYALFPLQGFLNCFIYIIRPRYRLWRRIYPDRSLTFIWRKIFSTNDPREFLVQRRRSSILLQQREDSMRSKMFASRLFQSIYFSREMSDERRISAAIPEGEQCDVEQVATHPSTASAEAVQDSPPRCIDRILGLRHHLTRQTNNRPSEHAADDRTDRQPQNAILLTEAQLQELREACLESGYSSPSDKDDHDDESTAKNNTDESPSVDDQPSAEFIVASPSIDERAVHPTAMSGSREQQVSHPAHRIDESAQIENHSESQPQSHDRDDVNSIHTECLDFERGASDDDSIISSRTEHA